MRPILIILLAGTLAQAASPTTRPADAASARPGWRLVDQRWAKPTGTLKISELVKLSDEEGRHQLSFTPAARVEPWLRNWRVSVVEVQGSSLAWKLSAVGRGWNDTRSGGTQHLQLVAAADQLHALPVLQLTKVQITPDEASLQAIIENDGKTESVCAVISSRFVELAVTRLGERAPDLIYRNDSVRDLLRAHPTDARKYLLPLLRLVTDDQKVLLPGAADVYRVFPNLPTDPDMTATIQRLVPDLADPDPRLRARASAELDSLGRRAVQAAMRMDTSRMPIESADRIASFIRRNERDPRSPAELAHDTAFLSDCLADPDPQVNAAAAKAVASIVGGSE